LCSSDLSFRVLRTTPVSILFPYTTLFRSYDQLFAKYPQIKTPVRAQNSKHVFHQYTLTLEGVDRDALNEFLATKEIPSMIYYPRSEEHTSELQSREKHVCRLLPEKKRRAH